MKSATAGPAPIAPSLAGTGRGVLPAVLARLHMLMAGLEHLGQRMAGKAEKPAENLVVTPAQANREMVMADAVQNQLGRRTIGAPPMFAPARRSSWQADTEGARLGILADLRECPRRLVVGRATPVARRLLFFRQGLASGRPRKVNGQGSPPSEEALRDSRVPRPTQGRPHGQGRKRLACRSGTRWSTAGMDPSCRKTTANNLRGRRLESNPNSNPYVVTIVQNIVIICVYESGYHVGGPPQ